MPVDDEDRGENGKDEIGRRIIHEASHHRHKKRGSARTERNKARCIDERQPDKKGDKADDGHEYRQNAEPCCNTFPTFKVQE